MSVEAAHLADVTQLAAGVVAAKNRGDHQGAEQLLTALGPNATQGFFVLADVALSLVRAQTGQSMDQLVQELSLLIEAKLGQVS